MVVPSTKSVPRRAGRTPAKARESDRREIVDRALQLASVRGIEGISVGSLAAHLKMSRSGLFYHVKSLEAFQLELLDRSAELFRASVIEPLHFEPSPLEKVRKYLVSWPGWTDRSEPALPGGCPFVGFLFELDGGGSPLKRRALHHLNRLDQFLAFLHESAVAAKAFDPSRSAAEFVEACWAYYLPLVWMRQRQNRTLPPKEIAARVESLLKNFQVRKPS